MKKKIILIIILILIIAGGIATYFVLNDKPKQEKIETAILDEVTVNSMLRKDYNEGLLTADEYVRYNLYALYNDTELLDEKYAGAKVSKYEHVNHLVEEHLDELSDETLMYYHDKIMLDNVTFIPGLKNESKKKKASITDIFTSEVYASDDTKGVEVEKTNLDQIVVSPGNHFIVWYTTSGDNACTKAQAEQVANSMEYAITRYDEIFDTEYRPDISILSKGEKYRQQIEILKDNNLDEDFYENTMQVYLVEVNGILAQYNNIALDLKAKFAIRTIDLLTGYEDAHGSIAVPYILVCPSALKDPESLEQVSNHEMFHHYQNVVLLKDEFTRVRNGIAGESTANWASALITNKTNNKGFLNDWAVRAVLDSNKLISDKYIQENGEDAVGYAFFYYLYNYGEEIGDVKTIVTAMQDTNFLQKLQMESTQEQRNNILIKTIMGGTRRDYTNNNVNPATWSEDIIKPTKTYFMDKTSDVSLTYGALNPTGINYYVLQPDAENKYSYKFYLSSDNNDIVACFIGYNGEEYELIDTYKVNDNGDLHKDFDTKGLNYEYYYIAVGNSSITQENLYQYMIARDENELNTGEKIATTDVAKYQDLNSKILSGQKITREDLPESGYLSFRSIYNLDESKENVYITYYYNKNEITRIVFTNYFTADTTEEIINSYENDVKNNPKMYKGIYIRKGKKLVCEYTNEMIESTGETLEDLIKIINKQSIMQESEFVFDFIPEL